jgi:beta-phosphoglucomutase-like phosphatase (HAD superfamily)
VTMTPQLRAHDAGASAPASPPALCAALFDWDGTLSDSRAALLGAWHASTEQVLGRRYPSNPSEEDGGSTVELRHAGAEAVAAMPAELAAILLAVDRDRRS